MTELAAPQISSLMEALPGIAAVLRSPVANAMVAISRAAVGLEEAQLSHVEELLRYGVRRNLLTQEEVDKVLEEVRAVVSGRPPKPTPPPEKPKKPVPPAAPVHRSIDGSRSVQHHPKMATPVKPSPKPVFKPAVKAVTKPVVPKAKPVPVKKAPAVPAPKKKAPVPVAKKPAAPAKKPVPKKR